MLIKIHTCDFMNAAELKLIHRKRDDCRCRARLLKDDKSVGNSIKTYLRVVESIDMHAAEPNQHIRIKSIFCVIHSLSVRRYSHAFHEPFFV